MIIPGWVLSGYGVVNLALIPVCRADFYPENARDICVALSIGVGVAGLGVGIPLLVLGYNRRAKRKAWEQQHSALNHLLRTQLALQNNSALVVYRGTF